MNDLIRAKLNKIVELQDNKSFLNNLGLLFSTREKVLNRFKSKVSPIKNLDKITTRELTEPATELEVAKEPTKATKSKNKTQNIFINIALRGFKYNQNKKKISISKYLRNFFMINIHHF